MSTAPVLVIVFNRPEVARRTFAAIRTARPNRLYVAADGPRSEAERALCERARAVTELIDWPCEVQRLYSESNLGCRAGVESALDWFFAHESEGIVLEDRKGETQWRAV